MSASVLFVAAALNGLVIYLFSRIHAVDASAHTIVLLWMISLAPLVYAVRRTSFTVLLCIAFFVWVGAFVHANASVDDAVDRFVLLPVTYLAAGVALFSIGGFHDLHPELRPIARTYRLAGLQVAAVSLLALGLETFGGRAAGMSGWRRFEASNHFIIALLSLCAIGAAFTVINWRLAHRLKAITKAETPICLAMSAFVALHALVPLPSIAYLVLWNGVFLAMALVALRTGLVRHDARLVELGCAGLGAVVVARTIDFGWSRLSLGTLSIVLAALIAACVAALLVLRGRVSPGASAAPAAPAAAPEEPAENTSLDPELQDLLREARAARKEAAP